MASSPKLTVLLAVMATALLGPARSSMVNHGGFLRFISTFDENILRHERQLSPFGFGQSLAQGNDGPSGGDGGGGGAGAGTMAFVTNPDTSRFLFIVFIAEVSAVGKL